ncbi:MAG: ATP-binding cassette domain-containing protein [Planctomycetota bacterium]
MIELHKVTIRAGEFKLQELEMSIEAGQYAVLMGKTGIGKTTILEAICGLRRVESGSIRIAGDDVTTWLPAQRGVGYVPQDLALFPTMTVLEHLQFAMKLRKSNPEKIAKRVEELSRVLEIDGLLSRGVQALSGGEKQRVALGRALSFEPSVLLLDEPLSALDADTRESARNLLKQINEQTGVTVLHVTHDEEEARLLAAKRIQIVQIDGRTQFTTQVTGRESPAARTRA